MLNIGYVIANQ